MKENTFCFSSSCVNVWQNSQDYLSDAHNQLYSIASTLESLPWQTCSYMGSINHELTEMSIQCTQALDTYCCYLELKHYQVQDCAPSGLGGSNEQ